MKNDEQSTELKSELNNHIETTPDVMDDLGKAIDSVEIQSTELKSELNNHIETTSGVMNDLGKSINSLEIQLNEIKSKIEGIKSEVLLQAKDIIIEVERRSQNNTNIALEKIEQKVERQFYVIYGGLLTTLLSVVAGFIMKGLH